MISTARIGAVSVVDKYGRVIYEPDFYGVWHWVDHPATFDGKRLVRPSTCELHPKYQALRPPRSEKPGCTCAEIYSWRKR